MKKDKFAIKKILDEVELNVDPQLKHMELIGRLDAYVTAQRIEAMAWAHADNCATLDNEEDPRKKALPDMLARMDLELADE